jgi:hypothetical protein
MYCSRDPAVALRWYRGVTFLGVSHISPLVFTFSVLWLKLFDRQRFFVILSFLLAPIFYLGCLFTPYGIPTIQKYYWGYYPHYGVFAKAFLFFFFAYFLAAFYNFFTQLKKEKDPIKKKQIQLITIAFLISITGSFDYLPKLIWLPLYPFGYGLSYTTFDISAPRLARPSIRKGDTVRVSVDVANTGSRAGDEVVQLYVSDLQATVTRPVKELKHFKRVTLEPGARTTVEFDITSADLWMWNEAMERVVEPGDFTLAAGPNSVDLKPVTLTVTE